MKSVDLELIRIDFEATLNKTRELLRHGQASIDNLGVSDLSRETRGLAYVLLYAAYERLLKSTCRELLETAATHDGNLSDLKPYFCIAGIHASLQSVRDSSDRKRLLSQTALDIIRIITDENAQYVPVDFFPEDGSHMRKEQVSFMCSFFNLSDPRAIFQSDFELIDRVVNNRNAIAHGGRLPEEVGREYTYMEMTDLVDKWESRWMQFLDLVGEETADDGFFLA